jgi:hypothetical protein
MPAATKSHIDISTVRINIQAVNTFLQHYRVHGTYSSFPPSFCPLLLRPRRKIFGLVIQLRVIRFLIPNLNFIELTSQHHIGILCLHTPINFGNKHPAGTSTTILAPSGKIPDKFYIFFVLVKFAQFLKSICPIPF